MKLLVPNSLTWLFSYMSASSMGGSGGLVSLLKFSEENSSSWRATHAKSSWQVMIHCCNFSFQCIGSSDRSLPKKVYGSAMASGENILSSIAVPMSPPVGNQRFGDTYGSALNDTRECCVIFKGRFDGFNRAGILITSFYQRPLPVILSRFSRVNDCLQWPQIPLSQKIPSDFQVMSCFILAPSTPHTLQLRV